MSLLSQQMGEIQPEGQVKGLEGCSFIALICSRWAASNWAVSSLHIMAQMYKVFINANLLVLAQEAPNYLPGYPHPHYVIYQNGLTLTRLIELMENRPEEGLCYIVYGEPTDVLWKKFRKNYDLVEAAGGLVRNEKDQILCIFRNQRWDLPKGKLDKGETPEEAAVREVAEECGLEQIELGPLLIETYHTYGSPGNRKLKRTTWYKMTAPEQPLTPQEDEGITDIKWFKEKKLHKVLINTYPGILEVLSAEIMQPGWHVAREWHGMIGFE